VNIHLLAAAILEGNSASDLVRGRTIRVVRDPSHEQHFQIPVPASKRGGNQVVLFKPKTATPAKEAKEAILRVVRTRLGYYPGDVFTTPWGNFAVTDTLGVQEA
jgi:hypothetical protein